MIEIRKANIGDLEPLLENRIEFITSIREITNLKEFKEETRAYLKENLEKENLIAYIAIEARKIISSSILAIYNILPTPSSLKGKNGVLLNVYTLKEYRRQGLSQKLLEELIIEAKARGVSKIQLDYTEDGYELYKKLGFEVLEREMVLKLG